MATYTWTRTREQVQSMVLRKLGVLAEGQSAEPEDVEIVNEAIDARLKEFHRLHVLWFSVTGAATSVTLDESPESLSAVTDFLYPISLMVSKGTDSWPVEIIGHRQYQEITDKTQTGDPEKAFFSGGNVYLWPVPSQTYTGNLTYQAIAADSEQAAALDIDVAMVRCFADIVAGDLIDDYSITGERAARLERRQAIGRRDLLALNAQKVGNATVSAEYY